MKKLICLICLSLIMINGKSENYAVLISAGLTTNDDVMYHSEYWYDLFLAYEDLILNEGYTHDNVYVFYGNGSDFTSSHARFNRSLHGWTDPIVDFNNAKSTLNTQLANLGSLISNNDNVHIRWVCGHGSSSTADNYYATIENQSQTVTEQELYTMMGQISNYSRRKMLWMTCHSGCLVHGTYSFNNDNTVIITSCDWDQVSYSLSDGGHPFAELNYVITSALYGEDADGTPHDADVNNDNETSMNELFVYADNSSSMHSDPQLGDDCPRCIRTFIDENIELSGANISNTTYYETDNIQASSYIVNGSGGNVIFAATNGTVKLNLGFRAQSGCSFKAYLGTIPCGTLKSGKPSKHDIIEEQEGIDFEIKELNPDAYYDPLSRFEVYPTITSGIVFIKSDNYHEEAIQLEVLTISGKVVLTEQLTGNASSIDLSDFNNGIYFIKLKSQDGVTIKKIIRK